MALIARASEGGGGSFTPVPPGSHLARCYRIVDLGTQTTEWQGKTKSMPKVMIQWEVHAEGDDGSPLVTSRGEPLSISKNYTLSLGEKSSLRRDLVTWRGRDFTPDELSGFELKNVLGVWSMLTVTRSMGTNGKEYTNVNGVTPVPKQMKANLPHGHNALAIFEISDPDMELFESFSDNLRAKIMASPEWQSRGKAVNIADLDDSIPF